VIIIENRPVEKINTVCINTAITETVSAGSLTRCVFKLS